MLFCCFEAFLGKFTENLYLYSKNDYLRKKHRNTKKDYFAQQIEK